VIHPRAKPRLYSPATSSPYRIRIGTYESDLFALRYNQDTVALSPDNTSHLFQEKISRMVLHLSVKQLRWALLLAASSLVNSHLHDVIKGMDVSSGDTVIVVSRYNMLSSDNGGLSWKLLATPRASSALDRNEIIISPAFDEDGVVFYGGRFRSEDGGENWQAIKASTRGRLVNIENSCAQTHKGGMAFHPHYNHEVPSDRRKMVMMAVLYEKTPEIWVSKYLGREFRRLKLSYTVMKQLERGKCPMLATMGNVTYLATPSMAVFATIDFGDSWSLLLPAGTKKGVVMQLQVDQTTAQTGHEANALLLVTKDKIYQLKPGIKTLLPLKIHAPVLVPIVLPDSSPNHPINLVGTHHGAGGKSSTFISRTECPTIEVCRDTSNDNVATSHNRTSHTWGTSEIIDWFGLDRAREPASDWEIPEFTHIQGVAGTSRVYIGTYSGIYRSDDGGDSWIELDTIANGATTLAISPAVANGSSFARVTACTYRGGCFWGEVNLEALGKDDLLHVANMVPQICEQSSVVHAPKHCLYTTRYSVSVESPTFDIDHIALRIIGHPRKNTQIERSTNNFASVTIPLETKIDSDTCIHTGKCSPKYSHLRVVKFSPNFEEDKTVYIAGAQGLWQSTDSGLTFTSSSIPRAGVGEQCFECNMLTTGWTGRDIVSLSFSPEFAKDDTMIALSQTSPAGTDKYKRYISVSTDRGAIWTDMIGEAWIVDHTFWTSAIITAGPGSQSGLTVVATHQKELTEGSEKEIKYDQIYVNQAGEAPYHNIKWAVLGRTTQVGVGFEHGGYSGYGTAVLPSGELVASLWEGGMVVGKINRAEAKLYNVRMYRTPRFGGNSNLPGSAGDKTFNELVVVSPDKRHKGTIFGVSKQDIYASVNNGATWKKVLSIPFRIPRVGRDMF